MADNDHEEIVPRALVTEPPVIGAPVPPVIDPRLVNPDFLERAGGPQPAQRQGGLAESIGQFATSNLGRNLLGALAVGLSGLRNPRDQGRFQSQILQDVTAGAERRRAAQEQEDAMSGLLGVTTEANKAIAAGDLQGASEAIAKAAAIPSLKRSPQGMNIILKLQQDLAQRAATRGALKTFQEGLTTQVPGTPGTPPVMGNDLGGIGPFQIAPGTPATPAQQVTRTPSPRDFLRLAETQPELARAVAGLFPKQAPIPHWDPESQSLIVYNPETQSIQTFPWNTAGAPKRLQLKDITGKTRTALESILGEQGVTLPDWLQGYNAKDPQALNAWRQATTTAGAADLKSEQERSAQAIVDEQAFITAGKSIPPEIKQKADVARQVIGTKVEVAERGGYAGAAGRQEAAKLQTQGAANRFFFDRRTMEPAPPQLQVGNLEKDPRYVEVQPNVAQNVAQTSSGLTIVRELKDIINRRRDLFPEKVTDVGLKTAAAAFFPDITGRFDPDVARFKTLALAIPNLVRALGDTANIAVAERAITQSGLGTQVMTKEAAEASAKTLIKILNESLRKRGFEGISYEDLGGPKPRSRSGQDATVEELQDMLR